MRSYTSHLSYCSNQADFRKDILCILLDHLRRFQGSENLNLLKLKMNSLTFYRWYVFYNWGMTIWFLFAGNFDYRPGHVAKHFPFLIDEPQLLTLTSLASTQLSLHFLIRVSVPFFPQSSVQFSQFPQASQIGPPRKILQQFVRFK